MGILSTIKTPVLVSLIFLMVAISGCTEPTHEEMIYCEIDSECVCGLIIGTENCYVGNRLFIEPDGRCFSDCFSDPNRKVKCISGECDWVTVNPEKPAEPVSEMSYGAIEESDNVTEIIVKNIGPVNIEPTVKLEISRDNESVFSTEIEYGMIEVNKILAKQIQIPIREEPGNWTYNFTLINQDGKLLASSSVSHTKEPPPLLDGFMYFHIKPFYAQISNITVGVNNTGTVAFIPIVRMTIYKGDMQSIFSESNIYSNLNPGQKQIFDFDLPPIENRTYHFNFVLDQKDTNITIEEITHEVTVGT
jgi:hypothetical protein